MVTPPPAVASEIGAASFRVESAARNGMVSTVCAKIAEPPNSTRATAHLDMVTSFCTLTFELTEKGRGTSAQQILRQICGFSTAGVDPWLRGHPDRPLRAAPLA